MVFLLTMQIADICISRVVNVCVNANSKAKVKMNGEKAHHLFFVRFVCVFCTERDHCFLFINWLRC